MTSGHKTVAVFLTLICGLVLTIVGFSTRWPVWAWPAAALVLIVATVLAVRLTVRRQDPFASRYLQEPDRPLPPLERRELRITGVALPSQLDDYDFLLSATVRWCPLAVPAGSPPVNQSGLAVEAVLARAGRVTDVRHPSRSSLVEHELNGALATMEEDGAGRVQAMAMNITLTLAEEDSVRLSKLAAVRKDEAVWEHERKYEQSRRAYLGEDVLRNTGSAVVWWLHRNEDRVDKAVKDLGLLAQLTSAANDVDVSERLRHLVPRPLPPQDMERDLAGAGPAGSPAGEPSAEEPVAHALVEFLRVAGLSPQDATSTYVADLLTRAFEHLDGDQSEQIRRVFGEPSSSYDDHDDYDGAHPEAADAPEPARPSGSHRMNGAGPGTVPPPDSTVPF
ncbi:hypothetical protein [Streptomyces corynorhini]|uniref:Uncharacterized protein n=1 Tax=Streptomyces corynorhini TaxID=2282652 RepID=A0A370BGQ9_9ACTN|nr:hypothetical protein [Streptomyces corynorhini]RDG39842.1 hypothetical protein DVH02_01650 [Streptomyces corynorhini]